MHLEIRGGDELGAAAEAPDAAYFWRREIIDTPIELLVSCTDQYF